MTNADVAILIPAYKPDARMNAFILQLQKRGFSRIVVVDDGGGAEYAGFFAQAQTDGAQVLTHPVNRGKGAALRTGLSAILEGGAMPVITADADGQHSPKDVSRMAGVLLENPDTLVLGARDKRMMPFRSRFGNTVTCAVLGLLTGLWVDDTQTGLRGLPKGVLPECAKLDGDRYEYEMNMLIKARQLSLPVVEMKIDTIYIDDNKGSHFSTFRDSFRIYALLFKQIGRYVGSSMASAIIETALVIPLSLRFPEPRMVPLVVGVPRVISATVNYFVNRDMVFKSRAGKKSLLYFYALVALMLGINMTMVYFLNRLGMATWVAKLLSDFVLFVLSYNVQQRVIFRDRM